MIAYKDYVLVVNLGLPALADIYVAVKKPTSDVFEDLIIDPLTIIEGEYNYYNIPIYKEHIEEIGTYIFHVYGYSFDIFVERECLPQPLSSIPAPATCVVTGNVRNITGAAESYKNVQVIAYPLKLPQVAGNNVLTGGRVTTHTDWDGFFSMPLVIGQTVIIEIIAAAVRFQAEIPDQPTVRIEDIMPGATIPEEPVPIPFDPSWKKLT